MATARTPRLPRPRAELTMVIGCTSAKLRLSQMREMQVVTVPSEIATGPGYGLAVLRRAGSDCRRHQANAVGHGDPYPRRNAAASLGAACPNQRSGALYDVQHIHESSPSGFPTAATLPKWRSTRRPVS